MGVVSLGVIAVVVEVDVFVVVRMRQRDYRLCVYRPKQADVCATLPLSL